MKIRVGCKVEVNGDDWWFDWKTTEDLVVEEIGIEVYKKIKSPYLIISDTKGNKAKVFEGMFSDFEFFGEED